MKFNDLGNFEKHRHAKKHDSKLNILEYNQEIQNNKDCKGEFCSCFNCCKCSKSKNICKHGQCVSCCNCYGYIFAPCQMDSNNQTSSNGQTIQISPTLDTGTTITGPTNQISPTLDTGATIQTGPTNQISPTLDTGATIQTGPTNQISPTLDTGATIQTGSTNQISPTLDTGATIQTGPTNQISPTLDTGATIQTGTTNQISPTLDTGATIQTGSTNQISPTIDTGATIQTGPTNQISPSGPDRPQGLSEYACIFNLLGQTIEAEANIPFSNNGFITEGIIHTPGTDLILLANAGDYLINFNVIGGETNQFTLYQNTNPVLESTYVSVTGTQLSMGMVIITASAGDFISLKNHSSAATVLQQASSSGLQSNANASILIQKIN